MTMMFWEFWDLHPFLAWCALWLLWVLIAVPPAIAAIVNGVLKLIARFFRMVMVTLRGWPPPHLDADGDFEPRPTRQPP